MGDHDMIRAAAAAMSSWWNVAVPPESGSAELSAGFAGWSLAPAATHDHMGDTYRQRSTATTASSESPGSNSFSNSSSVTFQEHANIGDLGLAVPPPPFAGFAEWSQPFLNTTTLHGFLHDGHQDMSTRSDQHHISKSNSQFLSSLQSELLLSPTSPYGVQSSLLRSLVEPTASAATVAPMSRPSPGFQQYQYQQMNQAAPAAATMREPLQLTDEAAPVWNPSVGFGIPAVRPPPAPVSPANLAAKTPLEGVEDAISIIAKKVNTEPAFKKPRIETPSPLPTFKVRKEKLGDRITALQQLVSPFGKTDTASVLHETIEYIKFLHHQVGTLSAPYLKNGHQVPHSKSSSEHKSKDGEGSPERGLRGRGLCLVPISSTFAVASEAPVDFWTPFGATFR